MAPPKKPSLLDRALRVVGLARASAPRRASRVYAGAQINRMTSDWMASSSSADQDLKADLRLLRVRARELERDNPIVARFRELQADNIIGPDGVRLQCQVRTRDGSDFDREANTKIEAAFDEWSMPEYASVTGLQSLTDIATQMVERWKVEGEAIVRVWRGFNNKFGFALQPLDCDLLDHELSRVATDTTGEIRMGVERDKFGKPTHYWMWTAHPYDLLYNIPRERERVPASDIIHLYTIRRPGQTRGVTDLTPVMLGINMLGQYFETELVAARAGAGNMFFIIPGEDGEGPDPDEAPNTPAEMESAPGMGYRLNKGDTVQQYKPEHPIGAFGPFLLNALRFIASGLHTAYASLTGDLSGANYSSMRVGLLSERDGYRRAQMVIAMRFYRPVFLEWLKYATLTRALDLPASQLARLSAHKWMPRGFPWIDPVKDMEAAILAVDHGFNTRSNICAGDGRDFEEVIAQLAQEQAIADEYGVELPAADKTTDTQTASPNDDSSSAGSGNDGNADGGAADDAAGSSDSARGADGAPEARSFLRLFRRSRAGRRDRLAG